MALDKINQEFELIAKTIDGDNVFINKDTIIVDFASKKNGIVSSWLNGGYSEDLSAVFNHQLSQDEIDKYDDGGILGFLEGLSKYFYDALGLNSNKLSGLVTSADINKYSIAVERYRDIEVMAITTAGVRVNAVSAGDNASYYELNGEYDLDINANDGSIEDSGFDGSLGSSDNYSGFDGSLGSSDNYSGFDGSLGSSDNYSGSEEDFNPNKPGTINTIILINSKMDENALLLSEMIAVEAKAVALRELMASSNYSDEVATGTGTDGIAIFSNMDGENYIENVSKHAVIGELIAKAVIRSIKESLSKLQWLTPSYQLNALVRLDRFKMNLDDFYINYLDLDGENGKKEFISSLMKVSKNPELVGYVSLMIHIIDQHRMGLLSKRVAMTISKSILDNQFNRKDWHSMKLLLDYVIDKQFNK